MANVNEIIKILRVIKKLTVQIFMYNMPESLNVGYTAMKVIYQLRVFVVWPINSAKEGQASNQANHSIPTNTINCKMFHWILPLGILCDANTETFDLKLIKLIVG
jgi:hypothetical protein